MRYADVTAVRSQTQSNYDAVYSIRSQFNIKYFIIPVR